MDEHETHFPGSTHTEDITDAITKLYRMKIIRRKKKHSHLTDIGIIFQMIPSKGISYYGV